MVAGIDTMTEQQELNDALRYERGLGYSEGYKAAREAKLDEYQCVYSYYIAQSEKSEAQIGAITAQVAQLQEQLAQRGQWEPVQHGFWTPGWVDGIGNGSCAIDVFDEDIRVHDPHQNNVFYNVRLPADLRLCRLTPGEAVDDAAVAAVEAEAQRGQWKPVGDAFEYHCQCGDCLDGDENAWQHKIYTNGSGIGIMYADESNAGSYVVTPTDLALCRLTPGAAAGEWKNVEADSETYIDGEDGQRYIIGVDSDGNMYVESRQPRRVLVALSSDDWRLQRRVRPVQSEVVSVPKDAADAADRVLNRLAGMFGDDAGNMPDQLHDDYLTVRTWLDALPAGWKGVGDGS